MTLRVKVDMPNRDGKLRLGMYAYAKLTRTFPETWCVANAAVARQGDVAVCIWEENGKWS